MKVFIIATLFAGAVFPLAQLFAQLVDGADGAAAARVRPGDRVALKAWMEPELTDTFQVSETGDVVLPKLGTVRATNFGVASLQDSLRTGYAEFLRNPSVEIVVLRRVGVVGEVRAPDLYWIDLTMTVRDVVALAGGLTEAANSKNVAIVRGNERIEIGGGQSAESINAELLSGDQLVIGRQSWIARNSLGVIGTGMGLIAFLINYLTPLLK